MNALIFAIKLLAVYRLASMLALETGPFAAFERTRNWAINRWRADWIIEGVQCPLCISFWLGIVIAALPWTWPIAYGCTALALSAGTVVIEKWSRDE